MSINLIQSWKANVIISIVKNRKLRLSGLYHLTTVSWLYFYESYKCQFLFVIKTIIPFFRPEMKAWEFK